MGILKDLSEWLFQRRTTSLIGLIQVAFLIWINGPLIAVAGIEPLESPLARQTIIGLIFFWWVTSNIWSIIKSKKANIRVIDELASSRSEQVLLSTEDKASQEEIETLSRGFKEALSFLKMAKFGGRGRKRYLYQLPWYLIVGPPGVGKTTALRNSGLKFPLRDKLDKDVVKGVGGTRNCDWWFTDEAVLLDTAGRYTTQDSDAVVDRAAWSGFLKLIKKHRRLRPLDGVIVAFSLSDLMQQDTHQRQLHSRAIRKRLQEVTEEFKIKVPVYLVFTKCDLIAGFVEFFDDLSREERGQVWGMTFPIDESEKRGDPTELFDSEYDQIIERLHRRMLSRLDQESDPQRRGAIYGFKQQMASLKRPINEFLSDTFQPGKFEELCMFRGVYFSSGTQEGTPIDRMISSISGTFGLDQQMMPAFSGPGRSYFLTRLLRKVVFQESDLVSKTGIFDKHRLWFQRLAYGSALSVIIGMTAAWSISFKNNQTYIEDFDNHLNKYQKLSEAMASAEGGVSEMLIPLNVLRNFPGGYGDQELSVALSMGFGLYQGKKLSSVARATYLRVLNAVLLPHIMMRLEAQIRESKDQTDFLYQALKAYLMLGNPKYLDWNFVREWLTLDLNTRLPGEINAILRQQFEQHLTSLLDEPLVTPDLNPTLINQARENISQQPFDQWVYAKIKNQISSKGLKEWRITDKIPDVALYFQRESGESMSKGIPGLFSFNGMKKEFLDKLPKYIEEATAETWVLGEKYSRIIMRKTDPELLPSKVKILYFQEYIRIWENYIADVNIRKFDNLSEAVNNLNVLSSSNSPIKRFLAAVGEETRLTKPSLDMDELLKESEKIPGLAQRLEEMISSLPIPPEEHAVADPASMVDRRFEKIYNITQSSGDKPPPIDQVLMALNDLYIHTRQIQSSGEVFSQKDSSDIIAHLEIEAQNQPQPLSRWMLALADYTSRIMMNSAFSSLNREWQTDIAQFCDKALGNRYPFVKNSPDDVALNDFAIFFGPQGLMNNFFDKHLKDIVNTSVRPWQVIQKRRVQSSISRNSLKQFEYASKIRKTFFSDGGSQPIIKFRVKPVALDKSARWVEMDLGGQKIKFRNDPVLFKTIQWPPPSESTMARLVFRPKNTAKEMGIALDGPWAFFRLIDQGTRTKTTLRNRFKVSFDVQGQTASFEIDSGSVDNPFPLFESGEFACLDHL